MVRPPLKNGRFWSDKNSCKRPQVSLKISNGVTQTVVGCLAAMFAFNNRRLGIK